MDKYSFKWIACTIVILAILAMAPWYRWDEDNYPYYVTTRVWQFLVQGAIPCVSITWMTFSFYKQLKLMRSSEDFKHSDEALKKSILRARLSIWTAMVFVISQSFFWLRLPLDVRYNFFFWFLTGIS